MNEVLINCRDGLSEEEEGIYARLYAVHVIDCCRLDRQLRRPTGIHKLLGREAPEASACGREH